MKNSHLTPLAVGDQKLTRKLGWFEAGLVNVGMFPRSGGLKEYLKQIYPKPRMLLEALFSVSSVVLGSASIANALITFGTYVNYAVYGANYANDYGSRLWAFGAITVLILINIFSGKAALRLNSGLTLYKMCLLLFLIICGLVAIGGGFKNVEVPGLVANINFNGATNAGSLANGIYYVMFVYGGYANVNTVLDELHDPLKNLPRAAGFGIFSTFVLYFLANLAYFAVLTPKEISGSGLTVAATYFSKLFGGVFGTRFLPLVIALSPLGYSLSVTYTHSRLILETARDGLLPFGSYIGWVEPRTNSPIFSLALVWTFTTVFLFAPPPGSVFTFIVSFSGYAANIFGLLAVVGIFIYRRAAPDALRPIRIHWVAGVIYIVFTAYQLIFSFVPPLSNSTTYPYYLPDLCSILLLFVVSVFWYFQVIVWNVPQRSYNAKLAELNPDGGFDEIYGSGVDQPEIGSKDTQAIKDDLA
ncbi:hypothetical protein HDU84_008360 [Entophlyctis sp. JEL0112]|nr:hypothetical protein HDU84_008360 [Entophlyctis sp. JEL0112]